MQTPCVLQEASVFSGSAATQSLTAGIQSFISSLTQPSDDSATAQSSQDQKSHRSNPSPQQSLQPLQSLSISEKKPGSTEQLAVDSGPSTAALHATPSSTGKVSTGAGQSATHANGQAASMSDEQVSFNAGQQAQTIPERHQPSGATQSNGFVHSSIHKAASHLRTAAGQSTGTVRKSVHTSASMDKAQAVGRVGVESLGGLPWQLEGSEAEIEKQVYIAIFRLKAMVRDSRCAAMVTVPAGSSSLYMCFGRCVTFDIIWATSQQPFSMLISICLTQCLFLLTCMSDCNPLC